jgi:hypothetical protein
MRSTLPALLSAAKGQRVVDQTFGDLDAIFPARGMTSRDGASIEINRPCLDAGRPALKNEEVYSAIFHFSGS